MRRQNQVTSALKRSIRAKAAKKSKLMRQRRAAKRLHKMLRDRAIATKRRQALRLSRATKKRIARSIAAAKLKFLSDHAKRQYIIQSKIYTKDKAQTRVAKILVAKDRKKLSKKAAQVRLEQL